MRHTPQPPALILPEDPEKYDKITIHKPQPLVNSTNIQHNYEKTRHMQQLYEFPRIRQNSQSSSASVGSQSLQNQLSYNLYQQNWNKHMDSSWDLQIFRDFTKIKQNMSSPNVNKNKNIIRGKNKGNDRTKTGTEMKMKDHNSSTCTLILQVKQIKQLAHKKQKQRKSKLKILSNTNSPLRIKQGLKQKLKQNKRTKQKQYEFGQNKEADRQMGSIPSRKITIFTKTKQPNTVAHTPSKNPNTPEKTPYQSTNKSREKQQQIYIEDSSPLKKQGNILMTPPIAINRERSRKKLTVLSAHKINKIQALKLSDFEQHLANDQKNLARQQKYPRSIAINPKILSFTKGPSREKSINLSQTPPRKKIKVFSRSQSKQKQQLSKSNMKQNQRCHKCFGAEVRTIKIFD